MAELEPLRGRSAKGEGRSRERGKAARGFEDESFEMEGAVANSASAAQANP